MKLRNQKNPRLTPIPIGAKRYLSKSPAQTRKLGSKLAKGLNKGGTWSLIGDLGGGKTTLVKGVARGLGVKKPITSPTFVLMKIYQTSHKKIKYLCHFDTYRLESPKEALALGLKEYLKNPEALCLIEWGEKLKKILPKNHLTIRFEFVDQKTRRIGILDKSRHMMGQARMTEKNLTNQG